MNTLRYLTTSLVCATMSPQPLSEEYSINQLEADIAVLDKELRHEASGLAIQWYNDYVSNVMPHQQAGLASYSAGIVSIDNDLILQVSESSWAQLFSMREEAIREKANLYDKCMGTPLQPAIYAMPDLQNKIMLDHMRHVKTALRPLLESGFIERCSVIQFLIEEEVDLIFYSVVYTNLDFNLRNELPIPDTLHPTYSLYEFFQNLLKDHSELAYHEEL